MLSCSSQDSYRVKHWGWFGNFFGRNRPYWAVMGRKETNLELPISNRGNGEFSAKPQRGKEAKAPPEGTGHRFAVSLISSPRIEHGLNTDFAATDVMNFMQAYRWRVGRICDFGNRASRWRRGKCQKSDRSDIGRIHGSASSSANRS